QGGGGIHPEGFIFFPLFGKGRKRPQRALVARTYRGCDETLALENPHTPRGAEREAGPAPSYGRHVLRARAGGVGDFVCAERCLLRLDFEGLAGGYCLHPEAGLLGCSKGSPGVGNGMDVLERLQRRHLVQAREARAKATGSLHPAIHTPPWAGYTNASNQGEPVPIAAEYGVSR